MIDSTPMWCFAAVLDTVRSRRSTPRQSGGRVVARDGTAPQLDKQVLDA